MLAVSAVVHVVNVSTTNLRHQSDQGWIEFEMRPHDDVYVCYVQSCTCLTDMLKRALKSSRLSEDDFMYDDNNSGSRAMTAESPPTSSRAGSDVTDIDWMKRGGLLKRRKLIHAFIRRVEYKIRQVTAVGSLSAINQTGAY